MLSGFKHCTLFLRYPIYVDISLVTRTTTWYVLRSYRVKLLKKRRFSSHRSTKVLALQTVVGLHDSRPSMQFGYDMSPYIRKENVHKSENSFPCLFQAATCIWEWAKKLQKKLRWQAARLAQVRWGSIYIDRPQHLGIWGNSVGGAV